MWTLGASETTTLPPTLGGGLPGSSPGPSALPQRPETPGLYFPLRSPLEALRPPTYAQTLPEGTTSLGTGRGGTE